MGQKVNPIGLRLGINKTWDSRWISTGKDYAKYLHQDVLIRKHILDNLKAAGVARVVIERPAKKVIVNIHASRPGLLIGKKGSDIDKLKKKLSTICESELSLNILEVRKPELDARLIADNIAKQIERRVSFRRAMKRAMDTAMRAGALGIRVNTSGRLGGAEIARMEWHRQGRVPLHTLRSDVDFSHGSAFTTYGTVGIKVWLYKGEIKEHDPMAQEKHNKNHVTNRG